MVVSFCVAYSIAPGKPSFFNNEVKIGTGPKDSAKMAISSPALHNNTLFSTYPERASEGFSRVPLAIISSRRPRLAKIFWQTPPLSQYVWTNWIYFRCDPSFREKTRHRRNMSYKYHLINSMAKVFISKRNATFGIFRNHATAMFPNNNWFDQ